ncbi:hypothetical protein THAOC_21038 [Thalassiosira oceanica]|uniref:Cyclin N-terminal domain-containing protein n=1 Tax=Thalassiosira oceanica TaxID=159749 RepID=K0SCY2_THAOC|nr:hypothetical protein THAOC_21038 [Thalassiosira oceanica]|eukprot:EJK58806.1 hypothetical protein THAOC_21038 [Thalassiosira oceanica]
MPGLPTEMRSLGSLATLLAGEGRSSGGAGKAPGGAGTLSLAAVPGVSVGVRTSTIGVRSFCPPPPPPPLRGAVAPAVVQRAPVEGVAVDERADVLHCPVRRTALGTKSEPRTPKKAVGGRERSEKEQTHRPRRASLFPRRPGSGPHLPSVLRGRPPRPPRPGRRSPPWSCGSAPRTGPSPRPPAGPPPAVPLLASWGRPPCTAPRRRRRRARARRSGPSSCGSTRPGGSGRTARPATGHGAADDDDERFEEADSSEWDRGRPAAGGSDMTRGPISLSPFPFVGRSLSRTLLDSEGFGLGSTEDAYRGQSNPPGNLSALRSRPWALRRFFGPDRVRDLRDLPIEAARVAVRPTNEPPPLSISTCVLQKPPPLSSFARPRGECESFQNSRPLFSSATKTERELGDDEERRRGAGPLVAVFGPALERWFPPGGSPSVWRPSSRHAARRCLMRTPSAGEGPTIAETEDELVQTAMALADKYMSYEHLQSYKKDHYQLIVVVSLSIAMKLDSPAKAPSAKELSQICEGTYTPQEIESEEMCILQVLAWYLHPPTASQAANHILALVTTDAGFDWTPFIDRVHQLINTSVLDVGLSVLRPSTVAMAAILVATRTLDDRAIRQRIFQITLSMMNMLDFDSPCEIDSIQTNLSYAADKNYITGPTETQTSPERSPQTNVELLMLSGFCGANPQIETTPPDQPANRQGHRHHCATNTLPRDPLASRKTCYSNRANGSFIRQHRGDTEELRSSTTSISLDSIADLR